MRLALAAFAAAQMCAADEPLSDRAAGENPVERIRRECRLAFGREGSTEEVWALATYADEHGLANAARLLINGNEFMFVD